MTLKILIACESGGHLTQALYLLDYLIPLLEKRYNRKVEVVLLSEDSKRVQELEHPLISRRYLLSMPKSSKKYQRYIPAFLPQTFIKVAKIMKSENVDIVLSTAGWVAIPAFILAKLVFGIKTVYIHSWSRVNKKSDSGRVLYYFSDLFLIQWPELLEKYGKRARWYGGIV